MQNYFISIFNISTRKNYRRSTFCKESEETIKHLFLECPQNAQWYNGYCGFSFTWEDYSTAFLSKSYPARIMVPSMWILFSLLLQKMRICHIRSSPSVHNLMGRQNDSKGTWTTIWQNAQAQMTLTVIDLCQVCSYRTTVNLWSMAEILFFHWTLSFIPN